MFTLWTYLVALHEPCDPETCEFITFNGLYPGHPGDCVQRFCRTGNLHLSDEVMDAMMEFLKQKG